MKQILVNEVQPRAFEVDGLTTARSLSQELHENIIHTAFDDIPYAKGNVK